MITNEWNNLVHAVSTVLCSARTNHRTHVWCWGVWRLSTRHSYSPHMGGLSLWPSSHTNRSRRPGSRYHLLLPPLARDSLGWSHMSWLPMASNHASGSLSWELLTPWPCLSKSSLPQEHLRWLAAPSYRYNHRPLLLFWLSQSVQSVHRVHGQGCSSASGLPNATATTNSCHSGSYLFSTLRLR